MQKTLNDFIKNNIEDILKGSVILVIKKPPSKDGGVEFFRLKSTKEIDTGFFFPI